MQQVTSEPKPRRARFWLKLLFSLGALALIGWKLSGRDGAEALLARLAGLRWEWFAVALGMQLLAVVASVQRWSLLLKGQGLRPPWRFLGRSFLIGRFFGAFTPGGFTGLGGWRIYDIASRSGQILRATTAIGVEMVLGQLAFALVVLVASVWGVDFIGVRGVVLVALAMLGVIVFGLLLLANPGLALAPLRVLPQRLQQRLAQLESALTAYRGRHGLLAQALALGVLTHTFNNLIYVSAARALEVELSLGHVFFASSLQILATLIPASLNGIGLREAAAVALYTRLGVPAPIAVLIPIVGFSAEMLVSATGGLLFVLRRSPRFDPDASLQIPVETVATAAATSETALDDTRAALRCLRPMALALVLACAESIAVALSTSTASWGLPQLRLLCYAWVSYMLIFSAALSAMGLGWWLLRRRAPGLAARVPRPRRLFSAVLLVAIGAPNLAFRLRRDLFEEAFGFASLNGAVLLLGSVAALGLLAALLVPAIELGVRLAAQLPRLIRVAVVVLPLPIAFVTLAVLPREAPRELHAIERAAPREALPPVLLVVVDTLRADHLPSYGYAQGKTPALDAFAEDALRFDQAFANASWTRPSFASILTGTLPSFHGVMSKASALPQELETLPESLQQAGYVTGALMTNYNVSSFFDFDQGFDDFAFLAPDYPLAAGDLEAKLLPFQFARRGVERAWATFGHHPRGAAYQDAPKVTQEALAWIEARDGGAPWMLMLGYMDPHDPYYAHPFQGHAISRAANPNPPAAQVAEMRALYDGEITYWDQHFGRLVAELKRTGRYDETLIVVTSDHGEEFQDHGGYWHGTTLYDEQIRVPLFVKLPKGDRAGTRLSHWVQSADIMPTILRYLSISVPEVVQGGDLFQGHKVLLAEEDHQGNQLRALRRLEGTQEIKVIEANADNPRGLAEVELYRLDADPAEKRDLSQERTELAGRLGDELSVRLKHAAEGGQRAATEGLEANEEAQARLRALGYIVD